MVVDSNERMLDIGEIIMIAAQQTESEYPIELVAAAFVKEVEMPGNKFLRYGNTIFVIDGNEKKPGTGMFRALNADTAQNFLESSFQFVIDAYEAGFYFLVTQFYDQSLLNIFRIISQNPPREGMGYKVEMLEDGGYQVSLQLGPPQRQGAMSQEAMSQKAMSQEAMPQGALTAISQETMQ
jgi:hypothetical protein